MTVPTENRLSGPYNGNGVTTTFGYDFRIILDGHLLVILTDADGVPTELTLNVDYTVSGAGDGAGGSIETVVAPATGETITILRNLPFTQDTDLENQGAFQAQTIEDALDLGVMRDLVLLGRVGNSIHAPDTEEVSMELPPVGLRKNSYLLFDANGEPTYVNSQIDARYYGALAADPATRPDGSARVAGDLYFSTTTLGFRVWSGSGWQVAIPPASLTLTNFTETAASAKTVFTISGGYTVGTAFAYLNGVMLAPDEVTMSNGTTAVLASACVIGDEFRLVGYSAFSVADTLSLSSNLSDLPDKPTALTNLGFSAFMQGLRSAVDAAAARTALIAQQANAILTSLSGLALVAGDIFYATGPNTVARRAKGADGTILTLVGGLPAWAAAPGWTLVSDSSTWTGGKQTITGLGSYRRVMVAHVLTTADTADERILRVGDAGGILSTSIYQRTEGAALTRACLSTNNATSSMSGTCVIENFNTTDPYKPIVGAPARAGSDTAVGILTSAVLTQIEVSNDTGNITGGRLLVWGEI